MAVAAVEDATITARQALTSHDRGQRRSVAAQYLARDALCAEEGQTSVMSGEMSLASLLMRMSPQRRPGRFVFVTADERPLEVEILASVVESEGLSLVVAEKDAKRLGLGYDFVAAWITLEVHSALAAVGLTAAVSTALAEAGISCNVVAGYHHDHCLVPFDCVEEALIVLRGLTRTAFHV